MHKGPMTRLRFHCGRSTRFIKYYELECRLNCRPSFDFEACVLSMDEPIKRQPEYSELEAIPCLRPYSLPQKSHFAKEPSYKSHRTTNLLHLLIQMQYNTNTTINSQRDVDTQRSSITTSHSIDHLYASPGPASEPITGERRHGSACRSCGSKHDERLGGTDGTESPDRFVVRSSGSQSLSPVAPSFDPPTVSSDRRIHPVHRSVRISFLILRTKPTRIDIFDGLKQIGPFEPRFHTWARVSWDFEPARTGSRLLDGKC